MYVFFKNRFRVAGEELFRIREEMGGRREKAGRGEGEGKVNEGEGGGATIIGNRSLFIYQFFLFITLFSWDYYGQLAQFTFIWSELEQLPIFVLSQMIERGWTKTHLNFRF
jgi:hypothetical protein